MRAVAADRADHGAVIVRGVEPGDDCPGAAAFPGGADRLGGEPGGAAGGGGVPAAQPHRAQDRRGQRGAHHRYQRVQAPEQQRFPLDLRVPERRAFLLVAVDPLLRGINVDERESFRAGQQPPVFRERGHEPAVRLTELPDVAPAVRAQVRPERGRGADPGEHRPHRAVPQEIHVVDRIGARGHAGDQARDLGCRVRAAGPAGPHAGEQVRQPGAPGKGHQRGQAGVRQQVRVIEHGTCFPAAMRQLHLRGVLSNRAGGSVSNSHYPRSEGTFSFKCWQTRGLSPVDPG